MEKKFIQKCNLGEILEELAEKAIANAEVMDVDITFKEWRGERIMEVSTRSKKDYRKVNSQEFTIIDKDMDEMDVVEDTITAALALIESEEEPVNI